MKTTLNKYKILFILVIIIISLVLLTLYTSPNLITKKWQQYKLNQEFICPENQTAEKADAYLYKYTKFYMDNYPDITLSNFLGMRMQLLVSHKCSTTLQNLADDNNGVLPDQNSVNELKNAPYGPDNKTLKELK